MYNIYSSWLRVQTKQNTVNKMLQYLTTLKGLDREQKYGMLKVRSTIVRQALYNF